MNFSLGICILGIVEVIVGNFLVLIAWELPIGWGTPDFSFIGLGAYIILISIGILLEYDGVLRIHKS